MFVDLFFQFCCNKREKQDQEPDIRQPTQTQEHLTSRTDFAGFVDNQREKLTKSQELKQRQEKEQKRLNSQSQISGGNSSSIYHSSYFFLFKKDPLPTNFSSQEIKKLTNQTVLKINLNKIQTQITICLRQFNLLISMDIPSIGIINFQSFLQRSASTQTFNVDEKVKKKIKKEKPQQQRRNVKIWEPKEDNLLRTYYYKLNGNWHEIIKMIPGRNMNQCAQRWRRINPIEVAPLTDIYFLIRKKLNGHMKQTKRQLNQ